MSSRCKDDFLFWWLLLLAMDGPRCRCERDEAWRDEPLFRSERSQPASQVHTSPRPIAWAVVIIFVLIVALAWLRTTATTAGQQSADRVDGPEADPPATELAESVSGDLEVASSLEALPDAIMFVRSDVEPLPSRAIAQDAVLSLVDAHHVAADRAAAHIRRRQLARRGDRRAGAPADICDEGKRDPLVGIVEGALHDRGPRPNVGSGIAAISDATVIALSQSCLTPAIAAMSDCERVSAVTTSGSYRLVS